MAEQPYRENPFAAPAPIVERRYEQAVVLDEGTGPPWEQPGPWVKRFFATIWLFYRHPIELFRGMRRHGSWWMPAAFYLLAELLTNAVILVLALAPGGLERLGMEAWSWELEAIDLVGDGLLLGLLHALLFLLGTRQPLVTTYRVVLYLAGSAALLEVVPWLGPFLSLLIYVVVLSIAIRETHDISTPRAGCAVIAAFGVGVVLATATYLTLVLSGAIPELL